MTDAPIIPDLCALSAQLRKDDLAFRRSFALGGFGGAAEGGEQEDQPASGVATGRSAELREQFLALVEARTGIEIGGSLIERVDRLFSSMAAAALPGWLAHLDQEPADSPAWEPLVDLLTVHETYFFRDPDQLNFLRRSVLPELIAVRKSESLARLTVWCAGCSSGEEAYTLAMLIVEALRDAGEAELRDDGRIVIKPRWRVSVLGTDIDLKVLKLASAGCYADFPMGPFRSLPEGWEGYFEPASTSFPAGPRQRLVRAEIRALTCFLPHNLAAAEPPSLDVCLILCRNVLIYLSDRARRHAQAMFCRALCPDGVLALGPTDALRGPELFRPHWSASALLYRKK